MFSLLEIVEAPQLWLMKSRGIGTKFLTGYNEPQRIESTVDQLEVVEGKVPEDLDGAYAQTGPSPAFHPRGGHHYLDGDGMVHVCRIKDGKVQFANRWIQTERLRRERELGKPYYLKVGDLLGVGALLMLIVDYLRRTLGVIGEDSSRAKSAVRYHAGRLLAVDEGGLPYQIRILCNGIVETVRKLSFGDAKFPFFTDHPKRDPKSNTLHYFGFNPSGPPYCKYGQLNELGERTTWLDIPIPQPIYMHDFAVTQSHVIFFDHSLVFEPARLLLRGRLPFVFDPKKPARFGLLPKDAKSGDEMKWFETPPHIVIHGGNAWEVNGKVYLYACTYQRLSLVDYADFVEPDDTEAPCLTEYIFDLDTGKVSINYIDYGPEFPLVSPFRATLPAKYMYAATMCRSVHHRAGDTHSVCGLSFIGLVKYDLSIGGNRVAASVDFGPNTVGGEGLFVPRHEREADMKDEDDGYVMSYVHDTVADVSYLVIYDARDLGLVAKVKLPQRVPYTIHGTWVTRGQLKEQAAFVGEKGDGFGGHDMV